MRKYTKPEKFSVTAISGTYVVVLGFNAEKLATKGLLGFAINRTDHTENEQYWLRGIKPFQETEPNPVPGALYSTLEHPVQSFHWGDYTAKPDHKYTYKVVPLFGKPKSLQEGKAVEIDVETESEEGGTHAVYFNRGVAGSQAYALKFKNKAPDKVEKAEAFVWLSRGLEEAILSFISQANGPQYGLRASVYEFNYAPVLEAFKKAAEQGADVKIVYDSRKESPREQSDAAIGKVGIRALMKRREKSPSYLSHNKFIILLKDDKPLQFWTGSTNLTLGGIFGQANVGHIVRDEQVASKYLEYWTELYNDCPTGKLSEWNVSETPDPAGPCAPNTITPVFSPRKTLNALKWYAERMDKASEMVCLTAAFGVNSLLKDVLSKRKDCPRYVILDKKGKDYDALCKVPNVQVAVGSHLTEDTLYRWAKEKITKYNVHVKYIHTKFMLLDPLSDNPTTIMGSANFSDASTKENDENSLVISGDKRVADIYFGEFMRLFYHFYFRYVVQNQKAKVGSEEKSRSYLKPDDSWTEKYYQKGLKNERERILFGRKLT
jgi:phosphatidylserine/phosphatidylglycerophosphate/cardiolipin synthase-like enzyme